MAWGWLSKLNPVGAVLGAISSGQAHNRGQKLGAQMDLESLLMAREGNYQNMRVQREQENRAGTSDAWRKLLAAQHTLFPGQMPNVTPYAAPRRPMTNLEQTGADALSAEVLNRLLQGNPIPQVQERPLEVDRKLLNPGKLERITGWLAPIFGGASAYGRQQSRPTDWTFGSYGG